MHTNTHSIAVNFVFLKENPDEDKGFPENIKHKHKNETLKSANISVCWRHMVVPSIFLQQKYFFCFRTALEKLLTYMTTHKEQLNTSAFDSLHRV